MMPKEKIIPMKKIYLTSVLLLSVVVTLSQTKIKIKHESYDETLLNGKVTSFTSSIYKAIEKFGVIEKGNLDHKVKVKWDEKGNVIEYGDYSAEKSSYTAYMKYDTKGNKIEYSEFDADGRKKMAEIFKYDDKGNKTEKFKSGSNGMVIKTDDYYYDAKGNLIEKNNYLSDGSLEYKTKYNYNSKGNITEENDYYGSGNLCSKNQFNYDSNGNVIEENNQKVYNDKLRLEYKLIYLYDIKGNKIKFERYYGQKNILYKKLNYDTNGNVIEEYSYSTQDGSLLHKEQFKYDATGNKTELNWYNSDGSLSLKINYKYDVRGNKIEQINLHGDMSLDFKQSWQYEYDAIGNWIKKIQFKDDKPNEIIERIIEYY